MTQYFRKVKDPQRLLQRERAPVTGRRVPKSRSKRGQDAATARFARVSIPIAAVVGGLIAALVVIGVVVAVSTNSDSGTASEPPATPITVPEAPVSNPPDVTAPVVPAAATTELVSTTIVTAVTSIRLTSVAAATSVDIIPADPGASSTFAGPLPAFNFGVDCTVDGCTFSLRTFAPGTVTDEGLTTIPAIAGRFVSMSTKAAPCTGSNGTRFVRDITNTIDLTLSGSQTVNAIAVPQQIGGTLTTFIPEAGYVPHVGDVVAQGAETGCAGQTLVFTVAGDLAPAG